MHQPNGNFLSYTWTTFISFCRLQKKHITYVCTVLQPLYVSRATHMLKECKAFPRVADDLGHVIWNGCLELPEHTTNIVGKIEYSTNEAELSKSLGLCNALRRLVPNFARLVALISMKLEKEQPKSFGSLDEQECVALESFKSPLSADLF